MALFLRETLGTKKAGKQVKRKILYTNHPPTRANKGASSMKVFGRIFLALALLVLGDNAAQAQSADYVSLWKGEGDVDDSGGINHGFWTSDGRPISEAYTTGQVGQAFNIVWPSWLEIPHDASLDAAGSMTVSFWFRTSREASSTLLLKSGSWSFHLNGTNNGCGFNNPRDRSYPNYLRCIGSLAFNVTGTNGNAGVNTSSFIGRHNYTDGQWHHVVGMFDATTGRVSVYMDGNHIGTSATAIAAIKPSANPLQIGGTPLAFIGDIDEVAVHHRTLSQSEIDALAAGTPIGNPPPVSQSIIFEDFSDLSGFRLNGNASGAVNTQSADVLRVAPATYSQAGSAFLLDPISLAGDAAFSAAFSFQITNSGPTNWNSPNDGDGFGADGLVFVVTQTPNAVGSPGVGIGYQNIPNSIGVEFDTWYNTPTYGDQNGNHVSINVNGNINNPIGYANVTPRMNDGQLWYAWVDYNGQTQTLEVRLSLSSDRPSSPSISVVRDLASTLGDDVYIGFTSGTGGAYGNHDIVGLQFNNEYDPVIDVPGPTNNPPLADAGADQTITCTTSAGIDVLLDGSLSSDPDGDLLNYSWSVGGGEIATGTNPTVSLAPGTHVIDLVVNDGTVDSAPDQVIIIVVEDVTPPALTLNGAAEITLECSIDTYTEAGATAIDECDGAVTVSVTGSVDASAVGDYTLTYTATDVAGNSAQATRLVHVVDTTPPVVTLNGAAELTLEAAVDSYEEAGATAMDACDGAIVVAITGSVDTSAVGDYTLTYTATDAAGNSAQVTRQVHVVDTTPPTIASNVVSTALWPPNHTMHLILSGIAADDLNDGAVAPIIVVSSDEDANGQGDGNTEVDYEVIETADGSFDVYVRAERTGNSDGRTYTITVDAADAAGNDAETQTFAATVAKSQGKGKNAKPVALVPDTYGLDAAMPNPFNPSTTIAYQIPEAGEVSLIIYNAMGQQVRILEQGFRAQGVHQIEWNGRDDSGRAVSSGLYLYRFVSAGLIETRSMTLLK